VYESYGMVNVVVVCGSAGDCFDRLQCRLLEICCSAFLVVQFATMCGYGDGLSTAARYVPFSMEQVLISFKQSVAAMVSSSATAHAEVPKGELVVYIVVSCHTLWRARCRCPDLLHV